VAVPKILKRGRERQFKLINFLSLGAVYGCRGNYTVFQKNEFYHNCVSRDHILVIFGNLVAKEICNRTLPTDLKEIAGALR